MTIAHAAVVVPLAAWTVSSFTRVNSVVTCVSVPSASSSRCLPKLIFRFHCSLRDSSVRPTKTCPNELGSSDGLSKRFCEEICSCATRMRLRARCMFPNSVMEKPETWNHILAAMVAVRNAHGWD